MSKLISLKEVTEIMDEAKCEFDGIQNLAKEFSDYYTAEKIKGLSLDEFVIGFGKGSNTFCYRIEQELKGFGDMRGATSSKFGVWYGVHGNDKQEKYRCTKKYSNTQNVEEAFENVKNEILKLLKIGAPNNNAKIDRVAKTMFQWKLLSVYYPERYIPIFNNEHLYHFLNWFGVPYNEKDSHLVLQDKLIAWKNSHKETKDLSNFEFMRVLYKINPYDNKETKKENQIADDKLVREINNGRIKKGKVSNEIIPLKKEKPTEQNGIKVYPRNPQRAKQALDRAEYRCEFDGTHESFIRKSNGERYTEPHHLIPLSEYVSFEKSLDNIANIVSLCSECHNKIHYGRDKREMIEKLYKKRKGELEEAEIDIELDGLLEIYGVGKK